MSHQWRSVMPSAILARHPPKDQLFLNMESDGPVVVLTFYEVIVIPSPPRGCIRYSQRRFFCCPTDTSATGLYAAYILMNYCFPVRAGSNPGERRNVRVNDVLTVNSCVICHVAFLMLCGNFRHPVRYVCVTGRRHYYERYDYRQFQ